MPARTDGIGAIPSVAPPKTSTGAVMFATEISRPSSSSAPVDQRVAADEPVVELPEGPAGVGGHVRGEPVDRLELREEVHVVEVGADRERLGDQLLERRELERPAHQRLRRAAQGPVEPGDRAAAVAEVEQRAQRGHQRHLPDVERRAQRGHRRDRQVRGRRRRSAARRSRPGSTRPRAPAARRRARRPRGSRPAPPRRSSAPCRGCGCGTTPGRTPRGTSGARSRPGARPASSRAAGRSRAPARPAGSPAAPGRPARAPSRPAGSGRPRAARPRRSACGASGGDRPGRRTTSCARRCWRQRRPDRAWGSDPCGRSYPTRLGPGARQVGVWYQTPHVPGRPGAVRDHSPTPGRPRRRFPSSTSGRGRTTPDP